MNKIIYLFGTDGSGKSTLTYKLMERTKGHALHCSYDKDWNMQLYHQQVIDSAVKLAHYQPVILDRWAIDDYAYGMVFRGKESYDTLSMLYKYRDDITFVYCKPSNQKEMFEKMKTVREEMYDTMDGVTEAFEKYIQVNRQYMPHFLVYDYTVMSDEELWKELGV